jgi:hypothetical protein
MDDKNKVANYSVPFFVHEEDMARIEKIYLKELFWKNMIILLLAVMFVISNLLWLYREINIETVEIQQDISAESTDGSDVVLYTVGGDYYGESEDSSNY